MPKEVHNFCCHSSGILDDKSTHVAEACAIGLQPRPGVCRLPFVARRQNWRLCRLSLGSPDGKTGDFAVCLLGRLTVNARLCHQTFWLCRPPSLKPDGKRVTASVSVRRLFFCRLHCMADGKLRSLTAKSMPSTRQKADGKVLLCRFMLRRLTLPSTR